MAELRTQAKRVEEVEKKLEEYETNMEDSIDSEIKAKEEDLNKVFNEKMKSLEEEKVRTDQKLSEADQKAKSLQSLLDESQNELFDVKSKLDHKKSAITDDMDLLLTDLERANQRAATAEKEQAVLQDRLEELRQGGGQEGAGPEGEGEEREAGQLRAQLAAREVEVAQLVEAGHRAGRVGQELEGRHARRAAELERALAGAEEVRAGLEARLGQQADYEAVKKDLGILKTLEFPSVESPEDPRPLEVLILERSKALQAENSVMRLDRERLGRELAGARAELEEASGRADRQGRLVLQLEEHVEQLQAISTPYREEAEGRSSSDMLSEALRVDSFPPTGGQFQRSGSLSPPCSPGDGALLPIVEAQRERFRLRVEELETSGLEQQQQVSILSSQIGFSQRSVRWAC
jgi:homeobox protein cut-like